MEDDDEFGDLYTDVLQPLTTLIQSQFNPQSQPPSGPTQEKEIPKAATSSQSRPIDLNLNSDDEDEDEDETECFFGASNSNSAAPADQSPALYKPSSGSRPDPRTFDLNKAVGQAAGNSEGSAGVKLDLKEGISENKIASLQFEGKAFGDPGSVNEADIVVEIEDKDYEYVVQDENSAGKGEKLKILMSSSGNVTNFGVGREGSKTRGLLSDAIIPEVSIGVVSGGGGNATVEDDWDSDSEDDLQIVLNDTHHGPIGMQKISGGGGIGGDEEDEDDEDGDPLVIVADNDDPNNQLMIMDEPEWGGEDVGGDGERKEPGDVSKVNGVIGPSMAPKIGYNNHGYHHPFPSQFKYVRPGAAPMSGSAPTAGGTPGQVRPPGSIVPVVGRGRSDWRPALKGPPGMQKGFNPGYGGPVWASGASGRGYGGGLEFTLPSHKTIFEVDIDNFEDKPWRLPGIDVAEFFNFGLNEEGWKDYCKQLEQFRLETTMQSKIRVYESGRTDQDYDPDLPPELAAAAGIQDVPSESAKLGKTEDGQSDLAKGPVRVPMPTGRAIPVEPGYGERLPSIDTRKPRMSGSDVIIEIVCQDSVDDVSYPGNGVADQTDNDCLLQDVRDHNEFQVLPQEDIGHAVHYPHESSRKKENLRRRSSFPEAVGNDMLVEDGSLPLSSVERPIDPGDSSERTPVYHGRNSSVSREERPAKAILRRARSPSLTSKDRTIDKSFDDDQKEELIESADGNRSPASLSRDIADESLEHKDDVSDEIAQVEKLFENEKEACSDATSEDDTSRHASTSQKLSSQVGKAFPEEIDHGGDSKTERSSDNRKARSGSSRANWKQHDAVEEDVNAGHSRRMSSLKKLVSGNELHIRRKVHDERQEIDRHQTAVRGREESYPRKGWNAYSGSQSLAKYERDRQKEIDKSENVQQQRDEDMHRRRSRAEDTIKRENHEETGSRHRSKIREIERSEKDEHQMRKQLENGSWRASYDKDIAYKHREKEDNLKIRNDNIEDIHSKRRKEETELRRERAEREEMLHAHRETSSRRKRERDDVFDLRRRDDLPRQRDDDQHNFRLKEDVSFQRERVERHREREEWHRLKQSNEEILSRKEKGEVSTGLMRSRVTEEKMWVSQSRGKDEHRSMEKDHYSKETGRQKELLKRRDRVENDRLPQNSGREDPYTRGTQPSNDERRERHGRASTRDDRAADTSDDSRMHEKKHKENTRKGKESKVVDGSSLSAAMKNQDENSGQTTDMVILKSRAELESDGNKLLHNIPSSKRCRDDVSSGDERTETKTGRSKLERWTSHKERDLIVGTKATSSMKTKQVDSQVATGPSVTNKLPGVVSKTLEDEKNPPGNENYAGGLEINNSDLKPVQDRHLDTVEKLKKRSERFKLPMPGEKEITAIRKMETEQFPSAQMENLEDSEVKAERPARKRRWTSN